MMSLRNEVLNIEEMLEPSGNIFQMIIFEHCI